MKMIRVGLVGIGFMGWIHFLAYQRSSRAELAAFTSRDARKRSGDWRGIQGNFGPPGQQIDMGGMNAYASLDEMLDDPTIDVIDICLPPHLHVETILKCLMADKHVFCEKPLGLTTADCDRVLAAAAQAGKRVFVAHVLPFVGPFRFAYQAVRKNQFGRPIGGYFKRIIPYPDWLPDFYDPEKIGGPMVDLHVHDTHMIRMLFGMPNQLIAHGPREGHVAKFAQTLFEFSDPAVAVSASCGVIDQAGRGFTHGFELYLESATMQFEYAALQGGDETMTLKLFTPDGKVTRPALPAEDEVTPFVEEIEAMADAITNRSVCEALEGNIARDAIHIALCIQSSILENRAIVV